MRRKSTASDPPWGLPAELLEYGATVRNAVHGPIELSLLERLILNSPALQRLRFVRQLGTAYLAYDSATHTRLSHVIGTVKTFQDLWDSMYTVSLRRGASPNLLIEWRERGPKVFALRCEEARIAGRLGALLHDFGHIPMGHPLEDIFRLLPSHDAAIARIELLLSRLAEHLDDQIRLGVLTARQREQLQTLFDGELSRELLPMIVSKAGLGAPPCSPWLAAMVGDTLCADLLDYVRRDHLFTGLGYQLDDHAPRAIIITGSTDRYPRRMAIQTVRGGRDRPEVRNSVLDLLHARRRLYASVNAHPVVISSTAMAAKAVEALIAHERDRLGSQRSAIEAVEHVLLTHGDDPLLHYLVARGRAERLYAGGAARAAWCDPRLITAGNLARGVLDRNLFTITASSGHRHADTICDRFAESHSRAALEQQIAEAAEVDPAHVALWIGPHRMWAKDTTDTLVAEGKRVQPLSDSGLGPDARTIERSHLRAWRAHLIVDRTVPQDKREHLRRELERRTGVAWRRPAETDTP